MPTPVGFVSYSIELVAEGDDEAYVVTWATESQMGTIPGVTHASRIHAAFETSFMPRMWDGVTLSRVVARVGQDGGDDLIFEDDRPPVDGSRSGNFLPQNTATLIRKISGLGGRRNQGRSYVPYIIQSAGASNIGEILSAELAGAQNAADAFMASVLNEDPGPPLQPVILHRTGSPVPTPFEQFVVDSQLATQRNRLRK